MEKRLKKQQVRQQLRKNFTNFSLDDNKKFSSIIQKKVLDFICSLSSERDIFFPKICSYVSMDYEVQTHFLIKELLKNNPVWVPRCHQDNLEIIRISSFSDLTPGAFRILEPLSGSDSGKDLDFIIIPGLGFDRSGKRIGRGKGFYDRWLSSVSSSIKIGLAFEHQILDHIPNEEHDQIMDVIVTQCNIYLVNDLLSSSTFESSERKKII